MHKSSWINPLIFLIICIYFRMSFEGIITMRLQNLETRATIPWGEKLYEIS